MLRSLRLFIGPPVCPMPLAQKGAFYHFYGHGYYRTLIGNPMLEVESTGQRGLATNKSGQTAFDPDSPKNVPCVVNISKTKRDRASRN